MTRNVQTVLFNLFAQCKIPTILNFTARLCQVQFLGFQKIFETDALKFETSLAIHQVKFVQADCEGVGLGREQTKQISVGPNSGSFALMCRRRALS